MCFLMHFFYRLLTALTDLFGFCTTFNMTNFMLISFLNLFLIALALHTSIVDWHERNRCDQLYVYDPTMRVIIITNTLLCVPPTGIR